MYLEEVYLVSNQKRDGAFFLIVKKDGKYICVGNWLHSCKINNSLDEIKTKFDCMLITKCPLNMYIVIHDDTVFIETDWSNNNA